MVRVRRAEPEDIPAMLQIARQSVTAARWSADAYRQMFSSEAEPKRLALVVEEDGQVAGFIIGRQVATEWELENIAVQGPARRRGLGTRLLGEFLNQIRGKGAREIFLEVRESNRAACMLYGKWAFTETGRRKQYYQDPAEDALIFRLSFPQ